MLECNRRPAVRKAIASASTITKCRLLQLSCLLSRPKRASVLLLNDSAHPFCARHLPSLRKPNGKRARRCVKKQEYRLALETTRATAQRFRLRPQKARCQIPFRSTPDGGVLHAAPTR